MDIIILSVPYCPNTILLNQRLKELLGDAHISLRIVRDDKEAAEVKMHGSPTLLINGIDPFASKDTVVSFACRLYLDDDGHPQGAPSIHQLERIFNISQSTSPDGENVGMVCGPEIKNQEPR